MQTAKPRSRISELCCSVWPTTTGLPEKCGRISRRVEQRPAQLIVGLLVHRHVGQVVGVREDELVGFVVVTATVQQFPMLRRDVLDACRRKGRS